MLRLASRIRAWGELLDRLGWCVALDLPDRRGSWLGKVATDWISLHARDEAGRGTLSGDRINSLREMIPEKLVKVSAPGLLLWSPSEPEHERTTPGKGPLSSLSPREREILDWTREGKTSG